MARRERKPMEPGQRARGNTGRTWQGQGGSTSGARYLESCKRRAMAVKSKREFGQLNIETLTFVGCEHWLVTMRLGAIKSLEAGDTKRHVSALRQIEKFEAAGPTVRTAAYQAANVVQARLDAK